MPIPAKVTSQFIPEREVQKMCSKSFQIIGVGRLLGIVGCLLLASLATAHTASAQQGNRHLIRYVVVNLNEDPPLLIIRGIRFGETSPPGLAGFGLPSGNAVLLDIIDWTPTEITAVLPTEEPGNYKVIVRLASNKRDQMGMTIEAVGLPAHTHSATEIGGAANISDVVVATGALRRRILRHRVRTGRGDRGGEPTGAHPRSRAGR